MDSVYDVKIRYEYANGKKMYAYDTGEWVFIMRMLEHELRDDKTLVKAYVSEAIDRKSGQKIVFSH